MSMNSTPLLKFIAPVPVCLQTAAAAEVTSIFGQGHWEQIIVVDDRQQPVGLVNLSKLMPYLMGKALDWQQPLSQTPIVEAIATIPADLRWPEFCREYQGTQSGTGPVALVNSDGEFLGLLDCHSLLKYLVSKDLEEPVPTPTAGSNVLYQNRGIRPLRPSPKLDANSLVEILEILPMPLRLQSNSGVVLSENMAWRSLVGAIPARDWIGLETASQKLTPPSYAAQISLAQTATALFSPLCCPVSMEFDPVLEETVGSWQFVKIPLDNIPYSYPELASLCSIDAASWEQAVCSPVLTRVGAIGDEYNRAVTSEGRTCKVSNLGLEPLWLVLATQISPQSEARKMSAENAEMEQVRKDEFLLSISHELKTQITAILGLSSLLLNDKQHPLTQRQAQYAGHIRESGRQMMKIVNNLVDLSRLETGQLLLKPDSVEIAKVCQGVKDRVQQSLSEVGDSRRFTLEIAPNLEEIVADELRLQQMLLNLLDNAVKFTDPTDEIGLRVSNWSNNWIGFTVWDKGVGIRDPSQQLILQKFPKLENTLTQSSSSTDLGLLLTQGLAQLHGGEVTFISREGKGSEFTLLLPAADDRAERVDRPTIGSSLMLILETNPDVISDLTEQLRELSYFGLVARSQAEALQKARCMQPSAIFSNVTNPLLSGAEVLKQLKSDPATCHIRAIAISSVSTANLDDIIVDEFLSLPVESQVLHKQLSRLMGQLAPSLSRGSASSTTHETAPPETDRRQLTILCLSASAINTGCCNLFNWGSNSTPKHRIIESSDLDQASLLAKIWKPDVILLNDTLNPLALLQELSENETLASLPLVTVSQSTTQAANQVKGLSVFPCLVQIGSLPASSTLLQVIQVAASSG
ncbi:MAG: hybrid sensor histidine kinase/response regulator [Hormoscilla sp. SP12CHS1]|nr:hybrid sensor histidine kinase/response regulator [Hormoscilla sp. SP12CHS1]